MGHPCKKWGWGWTRVKGGHGDSGAQKLFASRIDSADTQIREIDREGKRSQKWT